MIYNPTLHARHYCGVLVLATMTKRFLLIVDAVLCPYGLTPYFLPVTAWQPGNSCHVHTLTTITTNEQSWPVRLLIRTQAAHARSQIWTATTRMAAVRHDAGPADSWLHKGTSTICTKEQERHDQHVIPPQLSTYINVIGHCRWRRHKYVRHPVVLDLYKEHNDQVTWPLLTTTDALMIP